MFNNYRIFFRLPLRLKSYMPNINHLRKPCLPVTLEPTYPVTKTKSQANVVFRLSAPSTFFIAEMSKNRGIPLSFGQSGCLRLSSSLTPHSSTTTTSKPTVRRVFR